jgi:predicted dehydrogenase
MRLSRRDVVRMGAGAALTAAGGRAMADGTVRIGIVGTGARGTGLLATLLQMPDVSIPAVCDIDAGRAANARALVQKAGRGDADAYTRDEWDYKRLCARDDLDAVLIATPWNWHATMAVEAMKAGKTAATEVPACLTVEECWDLVRTSEATGKPCMMLENVNYFENVLAVQRMVEEGVYGEVLHAEAGYQHDCRFLAFTDDGKLTWRGEHLARLTGNLYPTHPLGPVAWWMGINRGDRITSLSSVSTRGVCLSEYAARKFGADHPLARRKYAVGDINTTIMQTARGRTITLYFTISTPRAYDLILRLQGSKGIYEGGHDRTYIEGVSPAADTPEPFAPYLQRYAHPLWKKLEPEAVRNGGHGGCDYIVLYEFVQAVREGRVTPQDVVDAATWSVVTPLSALSVAKGGARVAVPDFSKGAWRKPRPVP